MIGLLESLGGLFFLAGVLAFLFFFVQLLIIAFQENFFFGLACLVFQVPLLFLVATRWDRTGGVFLRALASIVGGTTVGIVLLVLADGAR